MKDPRRASRLLALGGIVVSLAATWALGRGSSEVERTRRHFADVQRQVLSAQASKDERAQARGRVVRLRAQARNARGTEAEAFGVEADALESRLGWGDAASIRRAVLGTPLIAVSSPPPPRDVSPVFSSTARGCISCHVSVATSGYEDYPPPFRSHPRLPSYVGAESPHPPSRVACVQCHQGDGTAETFGGAGHATLRTVRDDDTARVWADVAASNAMLPLGRTEAACASCHEGEVFQPGAPALNEAFATLDRGGCYACHDVPGLPRARRRGPDLRRIGAKLSPSWVRLWLADPRAIKPATWMPRFWSDASESADTQAEIEAVTAYLFGQSEPYTLVAAPTQGDPARGKALVESVGCLGCHIVGAHSRDEASVRRTFGQPLDALGGKTTYGWLYDWVREPSRFSPSTRMPNLRLSEGEASDIAAYLASLAASGAVQAPPTADPDDARFDAVLRRYASAAASAPRAGLAGTRLREEAGRAVIATLGCYNCHEIRGFEEAAQESAPFAPSLRVWRDQSAQTIHSRAVPAAEGQPRRRMPDYALGPGESARLALALTAVAAPSRPTHAIGMPWHVAKVNGRALVQERNCVGCHALEGAGGDLVGLVAEPTLGPPLLTPEGARVQPDWLTGFLHQPQTIRPWLTVRMPTFGLSDDDTSAIGGYLRAISPAVPPQPNPPAAVPVAAGRELFELLKCQQCHVLGSIPADQPTSNLAPDLRMARARLQPEWILAWLRSPSDILPGTRMPTFWPDFPQSFYAPMDRDGSAQIRAIRDHLLTLGGQPIQRR